ncbi:pirin family protein [Salinispira pacifica]|uniref:Pirin n=1 Tax=Salinispira pacifica TaxID=1307761 RepID=V5WFZ0_9SPIO|nr:pirin family protein [Salinispira pacifica]AHC14752.1 Pirin [Salinispira pacifica]
MSIRPVTKISHASPAIEGAGVHLHRAFGFGDTAASDPFLLFDDFRNNDPRLYSKGFPWHPHRGIETITYVLAGEVDHGDSLGNTGTLGAGDVQWMTAGSGIIHQEMPRGDAAGAMHGFQLWANLPSSKKMTDPRYQDIPSGEIPEVTEDDGTKVRIITGEFWGKRGPVEGIAADPRYLDISVPPGKERFFKIDLTHNAFAYVFAGSGSFRGASDPFLAPTEYVNAEGTTEALPSHPVENRNLVLFDRGDEVLVRAGEDGIRFLLVSGQPLKEPVAWHGPIVMNSQGEIRQALSDLQTGNFLRTSQ